MKRLLLLLLLLALSCGEAAAPAPPPPLTFTPCQGTFECATLEVPLDHAAPLGGTFPLAMIRARATAPSLKVGTVFVNPGGPGVPMLSTLPELYPLLTLLAPNLGRRFDVIGIDWRGAGKSAPVKCFEATELDALRALDPTRGEAASRQKVLDELFARCRARNDARFLARLDTGSAARDLELVRQALGEEKVNFVGLSYGTFLGATYATLFPERVRAFVLDGAIAPSRDHRDGMRSGAVAMEVGLERFFAACVADSKCAFHQPTLEAERVAFDKVLGAFAQGTLTAGPGRTLSLADAANTLTSDLRTGSPWSDLAAHLAAAASGDGSPLVTATDLALGRTADGSYQGNLLDAYLAIGCLDLPFPEGFGVGDFDALLGDLAKTAPRMGKLSALTEFPCVGWPFKRLPPVAIDASRAPPLLVINARFDPTTPYADAEKLVAALGNGSYLLAFEGDVHVALQRSACAVSALEAFLLDPKAPPQTLSCDR